MNLYLFTKDSVQFTMGNLNLTLPSQTIISIANLVVFFKDGSRKLDSFFFITVMIIFILGVLLFSALPSPDANFGYGFYLFASILLAAIYATHALWSVFTHRKQS